MQERCIGPARALQPGRIVRAVTGGVARVVVDVLLLPIVVVIVVVGLAALLLLLLLLLKGLVRGVVPAEDGESVFGVV